MNTQKTAQQIKDHIIKLAVAGKLDGDMNEFDTEPIVKILDNAVKGNVTNNAFGQYLCNDEDEYPAIKKKLRKALKTEPNSLIDHIDGITVWEKVEYSFTVKELCELANIKL